MVIFRKLPALQVEPEPGIDAPEVGRGLAGRKPAAELAVRHGFRHNAHVDFHRQVKAAAKEAGK